ncbi:MAG: hypothetical protein IJT72_09570 [Lachnospiraceae bacterium]|nr:hypothetical protein [Lachnospiraceae bacterium]
MRNCENCGELLGETVQACPYCGFCASDKEMRDIKHERIKCDMVYEEHRKKERDRKSYNKGFVSGWIFGRTSK